VYHFTFTGKEPKEATVVIRDGTLQVQDGHQGGRVEGWRGAP
jgi:hypothetical protein